MNFTLHLTADCNFACRYCYETHSPARMSEETAIDACRLLFSYGHKKNGFSLFGGEPLLCRGVIERVLGFCADESARIGGQMRYRMTTNGSLLDADFLRLASEHRIEIALSHDGPLQDDQRRTRGGAPTLGLLDEKVSMLLEAQPDAVAMLTLARENVGRLSEAVLWLYARGFSRVNCAIDYRPQTPWTEEDMALLAREYGVLAEFCAAHYDDPRPLRFLNFDAKIAAYIEGRPCMECRLGIKQPSIAPDGRIYPCNQFLNLPEYLMGDVVHGIDREAQKRIYYASLGEPESCRGCALNARCRNSCSCLNYSMTGDEHTVPAVQCAHERALIPAADRMAELLYAKKSPRFMRAYGGRLPAEAE